MLGTRQNPGIAGSNSIEIKFRVCYSNRPLGILVEFSANLHQQILKKTD